LGTVTSPIKQPSADEAATITGRTADGRIETVADCAARVAANYGFDVTPARLVSGLITERGVLQANRDALARAFPEQFKSG
jgi:methylthioribose-1-phosphate isomerase